MAISTKDRKILWGQSVNKCAFPNCNTLLIKSVNEVGDNHFSVIGEECHIVAEEENGPRGKSNLSKEERNKYDNLILLCSPHHKEIDDHENIYTVEKLKAFKKNHEKNISKLIERTKGTGRKIYFSNKKKILMLLSILFAMYAFYNLSAIFSNIKQITLLGMASIISLFVIIISTYLLLLKSNSKFNELYDEHYGPQKNNFESSSNYPIQTIISEDGILDNDGNKLLQRKIFIKNSTDDTIRKIVGQITFYNNSIRIRTVNFESTKVKSGKIELVDEIVFPNGTFGEWDEFDVEISDIEYGTIIKKNLSLFGLKLIKTHFLILNYFNYWRLCGIVIPFEITWLKKYFLPSVWSWFRFVPVIYTRTGKKYVYPNFFYKRFLQMLIVCLLIIVFALSLNGLLILMELFL
ncbi:hypothetical protein ACFQZR_19600 [Paenibacillus sp. GCM10027629]|uniref:hypothetical protein n=1 Tax=Paenibacillus sp. GCM10027629 TaxID=3273414 RepID=UPI00363E1637